LKCNLARQLRGSGAGNQNLGGDEVMVVVVVVVDVVVVHLEVNVAEVELRADHMDHVIHFQPQGPPGGMRPL